MLYVQNGHLTYAKSSYGQNAYITAIDAQTKRRLWRSKALVANAQTFAVTPDYLLTGYGYGRARLPLSPRPAHRPRRRATEPAQPGPEARVAGGTSSCARTTTCSSSACEHPEMLAWATAPLGATVWRPPADAVTIGDLLADGPILLLFYLFDWTYS